MKCNIRSFDRYIIRKHGRYLMAVEEREKREWWSLYCFDACGIKSYRKAADVARITGGIPLQFNFITGEFVR